MFFANGVTIKHTILIISICSAAGQLLMLYQHHQQSSCMHHHHQGYSIQKFIIKVHNVCPHHQTRSVKLNMSSRYQNHHQDLEHHHRVCIIINISSSQSTTSCHQTSAVDAIVGFTQTVKRSSSIGRHQKQNSIIISRYHHSESRHHHSVKDIIINIIS